MSRRAAAAGILAAALALALSAALARRPAPTGGKEGGSAYVYVVDWSGSSAPARRRYLGEVLAEAETLPEATRVAVFRMGSVTQETFDGPVRADTPDALAASLARDLGSSDRARGTDFPRMSEALANFARSFPGREIRVRVLTDGGDDRAGDAAARARYLLAAGSICSDPRLREIAFVGVRPGYREGVRAAFGRAGTRLRMLGDGQPLSP